MYGSVVGLESDFVGRNLPVDLNIRAGSQVEEKPRAWGLD